MIFGGDCQILFILCALLFALQVSTSNGYYLNNDGHDVDEGCFGCVGYKCKLNDGKIIEGKDCLKNVVKFCEISKSDVLKLKNFVQEKVYSYKGDTYFISSCQDKKDVYDEMEDQMNVKMDQRRVKRDDKDDKSCEVSLIVPSGNDDVSTKKKFSEHLTKCFLIMLDRNTIKPTGEAQNALNDVKIASKELLKIIDDANTTANEIKKFGDYFIKEVDEIAKKAKNVSTGLSNVDQMLKTLNESHSKVQEKCADIKKIELECLNEASKCNIKPFEKAFLDVDYIATNAQNQAKEYLKKANELMVLINETKPEAEKVFMEANVALTAQNAQQLANEAKKIGDEAKMEAKESKEIGETSNKTANLAVEIGIEAKMAANESMKIGNEANQKVLEVEKLAKDSLKLAETNQKEGDKTEAEVQKLKSNGEKNGSKIGIFAILLFAFIFL